MSGIKKYRESFLFVSAGLAAILTIFAVGYMLITLLSDLNAALNIELAPKGVVEFDIEGFEKLNLVK